MPDYERCPELPISLSSGNTPAVNSQSKNSDSLLRVVVAGQMLLALYYNAYRYPFQISDSGTSPLYSDTPVLIQAGKYAVFAVLCLGYLACLAFQHGRSLRLERANLLPVLAALALMILPLPYFLQSGNSHFVEEGCFWLALPILLLGVNGGAGRTPPLIAETCHRWMQDFFLASIVFFGLEILLFLVFDRLPALSYSGTLIVRFGGIWDDPNGFSIVLAFFIPTVFLRRDLGRARKWALSLIFVGLLLATQSLTGLFAAGVALLAALGLLFLFDRARPEYRGLAWRLLCALLFTAMLLAWQAPLRQAIYEFYQAYAEIKSRSFEGHALSLDYLANADALTLAGLDPTDQYGESAYINWLVSYGFAYLAVFIYFLGALCMRLRYCIRTAMDPVRRNYFCAVLCFTLAYTVGMLNLPLNSVFPVNLLFVLFSASAFAVAPKPETAGSAVDAIAV